MPTTHNHAECKVKIVIYEKRKFWTISHNKSGTQEVYLNSIMNILW